jgi:hypothetical protein
MDLKHSIKRFYQRSKIKLIRSINSEYAERFENSYETEAVAICRKLISKEGTVLLTAPISTKRYIKSDDNQLFITMIDNQLDIINHEYSYNVNIGRKAYRKITRLFDAELQKRREEMEAEIYLNVKHSLSVIYKTLITQQ